LINYYEILGLSQSAGIAEIKASFRQLAKLYHPDKNPEGIEHFTKILKAYETLSDPASKISYDYKLNYHETKAQGLQEAKSEAATKTWRFDERELKRRQYYNDHIKKYAKQTSEYVTEAETKKNYNEFKYILFATPLAVLLFLLIMNLSTKDRKDLIGKRTASVAEVSQAQVAKKVSDLSFGESPYTLVFGQPVYDKTTDHKMILKNVSELDVIVCLFSSKEFVRCFYLPENTSAEISELPRGKLYISYSAGSNFDYLRTLDTVNVRGAFTTYLAFYKSKKALSAKEYEVVTLGPGLNKGFERTDEIEFFKEIKK